MSKATRLAAILGLAGALGALPGAMAQDRDRDDRDDAGVKEAIRYEKAKQAAADRQERIEAARARSHHNRAKDDDRDNADRVMTDRDRSRVKDKGPAPRKDDQRDEHPHQ